MSRKWSMLVAVLLVVTLVLAACSSNSADPEPTPTPPANSNTNTNTNTDAGNDTGGADASDFDAMKNEAHELEVLLVPGYFTDSLWDFFQTRFLEDHPNWTLKADFNPNAADLVQSRILSGDPPPFYQAAGAGLSPKSLIEQGLIAPLDDLFASKAYDSDLTIEETMLEGFRNHTVVDGSRYTFITRYATNGVLYNVKMFEENGWEIPQTWEEFLALNDAVKASGMTPLMFTASFSQYPADFFIAPTLAHLGGGQAYIDRMHRFEEGAFNNDEMREALGRFVTLMEREHFKKDVLGLDHTQTQLEFLLGRSAMLFMGSWFEGEMKDSIPEGFEFGLFPVPARSSTSDPLYLPVTATGFTLNTSSHERAAKQFLRYFFSDEFMAKYVEETGEALITNPAALAKVDQSKLSTGAKSIAAQMARDDVQQISWSSPTADGDFFYGSPVYNVLHTGLQGLIAGNATIDGIMADMEAAAAVERGKR